MKILIVSDQYYDANNGLTVSARRFTEVLRSHGHEVRVASFGRVHNIKDGEQAYIMDKITLPFFDGIVTAEGMIFARPDDKMLTKAVEWADIVHIVSPFALSRHVINIARRLNKPYTGAYHVQPENITSALHCSRVEFINGGIYRWFHHYIFKYCRRIHCPSNFIANELKNHGYKERLYVISNGIDPAFQYRKMEKCDELSGKFVVLMIGRYAPEKRQAVLIKAVAKSKYAKNIQLVLAGQGQNEARLRKIADKLLPNPVIMRFYNKPDLLNLIAMSDLYVHAAAMEIEAMSCMEAFAGGLVPIIANSKKSATPQFALDERSLFEADNSDDLAKKIDYWYEHSDERRKMEYEYALLAKKYALEDCVYATERMFSDELEEYRRGS